MALAPATIRSSAATNLFTCNIRGESSHLRATSPEPSRVAKKVPERGPPLSPPARESCRPYAAVWARMVKLAVPWPLCASRGAPKAATRPSRPITLDA
ncbi:MAG: hypothetical protein K6U14_01400 [Firmicutes bacterium]|nr:hypothetical protein [Alicyclobacillaceae bacterium]MCL6496275.1 hypothetical protein [Bacillota bacterium]